MKVGSICYPETMTVCVLFGLLGLWKMETKYCPETSVTANQLFVISLMRVELISAELAS